MGHLLSQPCFQNADLIMTLPSSKAIHGSPRPLAERWKFYIMPLRALPAFSQPVSLAFSPPEAHPQHAVPWVPAPSACSVFLPLKFCLCCFLHLDYPFFPIPPSRKVTCPLRRTSNPSPFPETPTWNDSPCLYTELIGCIFFCPSIESS